MQVEGAVLHVDEVRVGVEGCRRDGNAGFGAGEGKHGRDAGRTLSSGLPGLLGQSVRNSLGVSDGLPSVVECPTGAVPAQPLRPGHYVAESMPECGDQAASVGEVSVFVVWGWIRVASLGVWREVDAVLAVLVAHQATCRIGQTSQQVSSDSRAATSMLVQ